MSASGGPASIARRSVKATRAARRGPTAPANCSGSSARAGRSRAGRALRSAPLAAGAARAPHARIHRAREAPSVGSAWPRSRSGADAMTAAHRSGDDVLATPRYLLRVLMRDHRSPLLNGAGGNSGPPAPRPSGKAPHHCPSTSMRQLSQAQPWSRVRNPTDRPSRDLPDGNQDRASSGSAALRPWRVPWNQWSPSIAYSFDAIQSEKSHPTAGGTAAPRPGARVARD